MYRYGQDIRSGDKPSFSSVAMMHIKVNDCDSPRAKFLDSRLGADCDVVEHAQAHSLTRLSVMTSWIDQTICVVEFSFHDLLCQFEGRTCSQASDGQVPFTEARRTIRQHVPFSLHICLLNALVVFFRVEEKEVLALSLDPLNAHEPVQQARGFNELKGSTLDGLQQGKKRSLGA